jgi:hypothetical protein
MRTTGLLALAVGAFASMGTLSGQTQAGGNLDFRDAAGTRAPLKRAPRATATAQTDWLYDYIARALSPEPVRATPRIMRTAASKKIPTGSAVASLVPIGAAKAPLAPVQITTGTIVFPRAPGDLTGVNQDDLDAVLVNDAERTQTRLDLVKLELARRTYGEARLSGQSAFDSRIDWRVLERGREASTDAELSAATAAGFEANAYINDTDKVIVVAIAGTQDLRRDFLEADIWKALIQAQSPQQFFMAKSYIRSVIKRYQAQGYATECVGHSLGGGACAYAASELNIRAFVVNPISAGRLPAEARTLITNYVVDGDIARLVYDARGNILTGDIQLIKFDRDAIRRRLNERYGILAGAVLVVRDIQSAVKVHQIDRALDLIAVHANTQRIK